MASLTRRLGILWAGISRKDGGLVGTTNVTLSPNMNFATGVCLETYSVTNAGTHFPLNVGIDVSGGYINFRLSDGPAPNSYNVFCACLYWG